MFEINDLVKLKKSSYYYKNGNCQLNNKTGKIIEIRDYSEYKYVVKSLDGEVINTYKEEDLEFENELEGLKKIITKQL